MVKAAFFDIDGTLLSYYTHRFTPATIATLQALRSRGVRLFIASGRPTILFPKMPIAFDGCITMNGGHVYVGREVLYSKAIDRDDAAAWFAYARQKGICTMRFTDDEMHISHINEEAVGIQNGLDMPMPPVMDVDEMARHVSYQIIGLMPPALDNEVSRLMPHCRLPRWHDSFTAIVCADNSKATGMDVVCNYLGIDIADTIAFGDGGNDIEMLDHSGLAVVMGNAKDKVKKHADFVTRTVEDDGISYAVEHLLGF